ncbi:hypothetical protein SteCoe_13078 [Stentor coeruleus]|uniref:MD-2-related lipid-recognition domain-containing protein n=1 Tax=Stentor coeruleus TaxID=5963 RepID=A0A1R2C9B7_9CILI|nr:hypothetical protein SteCoe_13078 [Stentor coeruleus]
MMNFFLSFSLINASINPSVSEYSDLNPSLSQEVGQSCGATNIYYIYDVDIEPWPPTPGLYAQMNMTGIFLQNADVQEVILGTCYNGMVWNYNSIQVGYPYNFGDEAIFLIGIVFPTQPGNYINNIQLSTNVHISCWQYSYTLS